MNISAQNKTAFGSKSLHLVKIPKNGVLMESKQIIAKFTKLDQDNLEDINKVKAIWKEWTKSEFLASMFCRSFLSNINKKNIEYFAVELQEKAKPFCDRVLGVFNGEINKGKYELLLLITNPEFASKNKARQLKSIGKIMLLEAVQQAKNHSAKSLNILSAENQFYNNIFGKVGLKNYDQNIVQDEMEGQIFKIEENEFDRCINYLENRFKLI